MLFDKQSLPIQKRKPLTMGDHKGGYVVHIKELHPEWSEAELSLIDAITEGYLATDVHIEEMDIEYAHEGDLPYGLDEDRTKAKVGTYEWAAHAKKEVHRMWRKSGGVRSRVKIIPVFDQPEAT